MKSVGIFALSLIAICYAATTTHKPHTTHEPNEFESINFLYSPSTHNLIVKQHTGKMFSCYIAMLTADEVAQIHTDDGLRSVELRVLSSLTMATMVDGSSLDQHDQKQCGHGRNGTLPTYYTLTV